MSLMINSKWKPSQILLLNLKLLPLFPYSICAVRYYFVMLHRDSFILEGIK